MSKSSQALSFYYSEKKGNIMRNTSKFLTVGLITLALSLSTNSFALAKNPGEFCVAVVDTQQIIANSPKISALKTEQRNKLTDLAGYIQTAKADIEKETDATKKKALEESYTKEINSRRVAIERDFTCKMAEIDKNINEAIKAKSEAYDLVLAKGIVLKGGTYITNDVIQSLK